jgi:hypothetical protein
MVATGVFIRWGGKRVLSNKWEERRGGFRSVIIETALVKCVQRFVHEKREGFLSRIQGKMKKTEFFNMLILNC